MTVIKEGSPEFLENIVINGKSNAEIPYVTEFNTETHEITMLLYDAENYAILGKDNNPLRVKAIVPYAKLVKSNYKKPEPKTDEQTKKA